MVSALCYVCTRIIQAESWEGSREGINPMMYYICKVAQYCNRINEFPRECVTGLATRNFLILLARSLKSSNAKSFLLTHLDIAPCWQPLFLSPHCRRLSRTGENQSSISPSGRKISFDGIRNSKLRNFVKFYILIEANWFIRIILINIDRKIRNFVANWSRCARKWI